MGSKVAGGGALECFWSDLDKHPTCPHGPTLLFGKYTADGQIKQFYACSACRDRKLCSFYAEKASDLEASQQPKKNIKNKAKQGSNKRYNHRKLFILFNKCMALRAEDRAYCHNCELLVCPAARLAHAEHNLQIGLSDDEMNNPTTIIKPLSNVKKEAQYLFSKKATVQITNMLVKAKANQVLCIGAPRIHEYITQNYQHKMSSLLLDFDARFHNFFGPLAYCWYNLFNHHFFQEESGKSIFREFLTQNGGKNTFIVCDPPFGGRVEFISQTLKKIDDEYRKWNGIRSDEKNDEYRLKIMFIFPYFMESIMQHKSNPTGIDGGLRDLTMIDYKVDYDNHALFNLSDSTEGSKGRKHGSPVRIFTNIKPSLIELPAEDGYKYCKRCEKWIAAENKHCKKCNACTSKDGRRYIHCDICERCVKPTWKHCEKCKRCTLEQHNCGIKPKLTGRCFKCSALDHLEKNCPTSIVVSANLKKVSKKRKLKSNNVRRVKKVKGTFTF